jgi:hypothetical protein
MSSLEPRPAGGLARTEVALFVGGVFAFAFLMLVFGTGLPGEVYLPVVGGWIVAGLSFVWWFDRHLAARAARDSSKKVTRISRRRKRA